MNEATIHGVKRAANDTQLRYYDSNVLRLPADKRKEYHKQVDRLIAELSQSVPIFPSPQAEPQHRCGMPGGKDATWKRKDRRRVSLELNLTLRERLAGKTPWLARGTGHGRRNRDDCARGSDEKELPPPVS